MMADVINILITPTLGGISRLFLKMLEHQACFVFIFFMTTFDSKNLQRLFRGNALLRVLSMCGRKSIYMQTAWLQN